MSYIPPLGVQSLTADELRIVFECGPDVSNLPTLSVTLAKAHLQCLPVNVSFFVVH